MNTTARKSPSSLASHHVLLVDDEASMRMALEMSYGQRGWDLEAASGKMEDERRPRAFSSSQQQCQQLNSRRKLNASVFHSIVRSYR